MPSLSEVPEDRSHEREAVLFAAAARALGAYGYSSLEFDIGGKKARRRYVNCVSPHGETCSIWIKSATHWPQMAEAVRFPWKKLSVSSDGVGAVTVACEAAAKRGATHLLAIVGNESSGMLSFARLYPLADVPSLVAAQAATIDSVFYRAHSAALVLQAIASEFADAAAAASAAGIDILSPPRQDSTAIVEKTATRVRSGNAYRRDPKVRAQVLQIAGGRCECCGELGFLTETGERYLETHHVVGVSERGPDSSGNIVAVCPLCHRKAHYAADRIQIERKMLEAIRRRGRPVEIAG
ncbi:MAG: HNH endonuclease [Rhodocyclaceae bacterium]|nr:HNH endonuclease [Rhodocyclaceae bacterium]